MPRLRLEDATCAICMDNLFDARDDLDEVLPIATPDCGELCYPAPFLTPSCSTVLTPPLSSPALLDFGAC